MRAEPSVCVAFVVLRAVLHSTDGGGGARGRRAVRAFERSSVRSFRFSFCKTGLLLIECLFVVTGVLMVLSRKADRHSSERGTLLGGTPCNSQIYYHGVQDRRGFCGPPDATFGQALTTTSHQHLNNDYVRCMLCCSLNAAGRVGVAAQ